MIIFTSVILAVAATLFGLTRFGTAYVDARYPNTGQLVDVDGVTLHCVEIGQPDANRPSLVFVHGASSNHREFLIAVGDHLLDRFGEAQHAIFVDRPGQGGSGRRPGDHSPRVQAERILKAAQVLGAPQVVAVGHSWGGSVVAQMPLVAQQYDDALDVVGAVFAAPATHPWPGDRFNGVDWYHAVSDTPILGWLFTRFIVLPVAWNMIDQGVESVFAPQPAKSGYAKALGPRLLLRPRSFEANAQDVYRLRPFVIEQSPHYSAIDCPVHVITGDEDGVVWPHLHSDGLERDIAGAKKVVISGAGHMPHQTHPELLMDGIADVMARADGAA